MYKMDKMFTNLPSLNVKVKALFMFKNRQKFVKLYASLIYKINKSKF